MGPKQQQLRGAGFWTSHRTDQSPGGVVQELVLEPAPQAVIDAEVRRPLPSSRAPAGPGSAFHVFPGGCPSTGTVPSPETSEPSNSVL